MLYLDYNFGAYSQTKTILCEKIYHWEEADLEKKVVNLVGFNDNTLYPRHMKFAEGVYSFRLFR